jgi:hypothetical protein
MSDFVFNVPLDESLFSLEPPAGYAAVRGEMDASEPGEKDLIEALRCYSDLFGGAFPDSFAINDKVMNPVTERILARKGWKPTNGARPSQEQSKTLPEMDPVSGTASTVPTKVPSRNPRMAGARSGQTKRHLAPSTQTLLGPGTRRHLKSQSAQRRGHGKMDRQSVYQGAVETPIQKV